MSGHLAGGAVRLLSLVAAVLLAAPFPASGQDTPVAVRLGDREATLETASHRGYPVVNAGRLAGEFGAQGRLEAPFMRITLGGKELVFQEGSPFFRYGTAAYQLSNPVYSWGGAFWLPAEFAVRWWPEVLGAEAAVAAVAAARPARLDPDRPWRVVVDPGHGGRDPGTSGPRSREKNIVLAIGRHLHRELAGMDGFDPVLTRTDDTFIPLEERSQFAIEEQGDLFVSVHANWARSNSARGFETIFLGAARTDDAQAVAMRENSAISFEENARPPQRDIQFILTGLDRDENLLESRRFGGYVQNALRGARGTDGDRGVKQGPWWVLLGALARMPSVIVEVGFVSHPEEERYLLSDDGQRELARAIATAIHRYRSDLIAAYEAETRGSRP